MMIMFDFNRYCKLNTIIILGYDIEKYYEHHSKSKHIEMYDMPLLEISYRPFISFDLLGIIEK